MKVDGSHSRLEQGRAVDARFLTPSPGVVFMLYNDNICLKRPENRSADQPAGWVQIVVVWLGGRPQRAPHTVHHRPHCVILVWY